MDAAMCSADSGGDKMAAVMMERHDSAQSTESRRTNRATHPPTVQLITPPQETGDSFSPRPFHSPAAHDVTRLPPIRSIGPSPPTSPNQGRLPNFSSILDAPLFSPTHRERSQPPEPLFSPARPSTTVQPTGTSESTPKKRRLFEPVPNKNVGGFLGPAFYLECTEEAITGYLHARAAERNKLAEARRNLPQPRKSPVPERDPYSSRQLDALRPQPAGVTKTRITLRTSKPKAAKAASAGPKATTPRRTSPKTHTPSDFRDRASPSLADKPGAKHKRAAPSKKSATKEEDLKWRAIPDFSPPIESLNESQKSLKAVWDRGEKIDISQDEDIDQLSPAEIAVAEELRLHPQAYLANKRRIFAKCLLCLKLGKNFTKTAAQNACNIDVNKASQLWEAFSRVGWFEERWFKPRYDDVDVETLRSYGSEYFKN